MSADIVVSGKSNRGYAAEGYYILPSVARGESEKKDTIFENRRAQPTREMAYTEQATQEKAEEVSYYRLMGDPWRYDGKKVRMAGVIQYESEFHSSNTDEKWGYLLEDVFSEDTMGLLQKRTEGLMESGKKYGVEHFMDMHAIAVMNGLHVEIEGMFYLYGQGEDERGEIIYKGIDPTYLRFGMDIHPKDREEFEKAKDEYFASGQTFGGRIDGE